jgi:hypothetical protein
VQSEKTESESTETEKLLEVARQRFDLAVEAEQDIRKLALEDLEFGAGEQWDPADKQARAQQRRPCLTINRLPQFIRQLVNDQRQNRPAIKVSPVDDAADIETAKIFQGIIRHIEASSDAEIAYDTAFDSAVRTGFGYFRIRTEYCDPMSFDLDIRIEPIKNRFSVYLDPMSRLPDGSDANWGFIFDEISKEEYEALYPDADLASMTEWASLGDDRKDWISESSVRIAEYFYKEFKDVTLVKLSDGRVITKEELPTVQVETGELDEEGAAIIEDQPQLPLDEMGAQLEIVDERKSRVPVVKHIKTNGKDILESTDWPGKWIPIIPVLGEEIDINGKRILEGVIRHAKDSMRMYNYMKSAEAEAIALAPKAPWIMAEGQDEGYEAMWKNANVVTFSTLKYKPVSFNGQAMPPPQRNMSEPPIMALTQASAGASEDMKATTGIYDSALGNRSNENSGIAIQRRAAQAQTSNFHFVDNLSRSIRHTGRQLVDLIPKVMDTKRVQRILGEDGTEQIVTLNAMFEKENGEQVEYNLGAGKYDVSVATGPSYETKRQEASASMLELAKVMPQMTQGAGDLIVKNLDLPGAQELAERLKKMLPPGLADDPKQKPLPPEAQAQMQQMSQMIEGLTQKLNEAQSEIELKKMEHDHKERIVVIQEETKAAIKLAELQSGEAIRLLQFQMQELDARSKQPVYQPQIQNPQVQEAAPMGDGSAMPPDQLPTGGSSPGEFQE